MRFATLLAFLTGGLAVGAGGSSLQELSPPIAGLTRDSVRNTFNEIHNGHAHEAIDIMEPRGTPVRAAVPGTIRKLFRSKAGGNTIYQFDDGSNLCYYYAHLDRYAEGLKEGSRVERGAVIGFVGSSGNASADVPHMHFAVFQLGPGKEWWKGMPIDPYPALLRSIEEGR